MVAGTLSLEHAGGAWAEAVSQLRHVGLVR